MEYERKEVVLAVKDVCVSFGKTKVLDHLSFEIRNVTRPSCSTGQIVGLLGPSGIGKTQLFRRIAGLDKPDTGEILIGVGQEPVRIGVVGVVAQHCPLFAHRTVFGNLFVAGRQVGLSRAEARDKAKEILDRFGLWDHRDLYPASLSGGQRQRVAISQQIMNTKGVLFLLMDEPFSGLDIVAIEKVSELISEVANLNDYNTIILVTHDVTSAIQVADTLLLVGRDLDPEGKPVPGAKIKGSIDLVERGLAWRKGISLTSEFLEVEKEVREFMHRA